MRYDLIFLTTALLCLFVGEALGIYMGITQDFLLVPAHVHLNLLGWVTLAAFGLMHRAFPGLATSRLALTQCGMAILFNLAMPAGLAVMLLGGGTMIVKIASFGVILSTLMFIWIFARKARATA